MLMNISSSAFFCIFVQYTKNQMKDTLSRISWLDYGKAFCMLVTMLFHTEIMYVGETSLFTKLVFYNTSMVFFFFVSGYLINIQTFDIKKTLTSLLKRLVIPYFIFTTIIYIPKHLVRGWEFDLFTMFADIFGGVASWFVATLIVSKLILCLLLKFTNKLSIIGIFTIFCALIGFVLTHYLQAPIYWYANYALISMLYLFLGVLYRKYEDKLSFNKILQAVISTILFIVLAYYNHKVDLTSYVYGLKQGEVEILGTTTYLFLSVVGIWTVISLIKLIPSGIKWLSYIGVNSLIYYFFNTGILLVIITVMNKIGVTETYNWLVLPLYAIVVGLLTIMSEIILRFAPWMVGISKKN